MQTFSKNLLLILTLSCILSPAWGQFQYYYQWGTGQYGFNRPGEIESVINISPGGTVQAGQPIPDNQYAAIGTDRTFNPPLGLFSWYDPGGIDIFYRVIRNTGANGTTLLPVEGVAVCENIFDPTEQVGVFQNNDRALMTYLTKVTYFWNQKFAVNDIIAEDLLATSTASGDGIFLLGLDRRTTTNRVALMNFDGVGNVVWSFSYDIQNLNGDAVTGLQNLDIEHLPNQGFVITGSGLDPAVNRSAAFILNIDANGNIIPDDPLAGIRGLHLYHSAANGDPLRLTAPMVTPTVTSLPVTDVIVAGEFQDFQGALQQMYVMRVNPLTGIPVWDQVIRPSTALFNGQYFPEDMDYNGGELYQICGFIENSRERAITYHFWADGTPIGLYEYDSNNNIASDNSSFHGNHFDPVTQRFVMGGTYDYTVGSNIHGDNWLVQTEGFFNGETGFECDDSEVPSVLLPNIVPTPGIAIQVQGLSRNGGNFRFTGANATTFEQCISAKYPGAEIWNVPAADPVKIIHDDQLQEFQVQITGEIEGSVSLRVQNMHGQVLWQGNMEQQLKVISSQSFSAGVYLISWETDGGNTGSRKIPILK